jgi:hypothetical protein
MSGYATNRDLSSFLGLSKLYPGSKELIEGTLKCCTLARVKRVRRVRLLRQPSANRNDLLHYEEQRYQCEPVHRLGSSRNTARYQQHL